ncbi:MAG: hypothetical protein ABI895_18165 [Deltaproteobacteria bacterium]
MWYRFGVVAVIGWNLGCSDAAPQPSASTGPGARTPSATPSEGTTPEGTAASAADGMAFQLSIEGWTESIDAKAQLNVTEGVRAVRLQITAGGQRDVVLLDVDFDGPEGSMGPHQVALGLPGGELDSAVASLDGQQYHSQTGRIDVSLTADGGITGNFDLAIARDPEGMVAGEPLVFELSEDVRNLKGLFSGQWQLFCLSHMPGHMSSLIKGGSYCDALQF